MLEERMKPEELFFKYAYPCTDALYNSHKIDSEQYERIKKGFENGIAPEREFLEGVYKAAVRRIKNIFGEVWNKKNIRDYFIMHHNRIIDKGEDAFAYYTPEMKELCKVKIGVVSEIEKKNDILTFFVFYENKKGEWVIGKYLPEAKVNDKISIHYRIAIEKLE